MNIGTGALRMRPQRQRKCPNRFVPGIIVSSGDEEMCPPETLSPTALANLNFFLYDEQDPIGGNRKRKSKCKDSKEPSDSPPPAAPPAPPLPAGRGMEVTALPSPSAPPGSVVLPPPAAAALVAAPPSVLNPDVSKPPVACDVVGFSAAYFGGCTDEVCKGYLSKISLKDALDQKLKRGFYVDGEMFYVPNVDVKKYAFRAIYRKDSPNSEHLCGVMGPGELKMEELPSIEGTGWTKCPGYMVPKEAETFYDYFKVRNGMILFRKMCTVRKQTIVISGDISPVVWKKEVEPNLGEPRSDDGTEVAYTFHGDERKCVIPKRFWKRIRTKNEVMSGFTEIGRVELRYLRNCPFTYAITASITTYSPEGIPLFT